MNDPHVCALIYRVRHDETVNYDNARPLEHETARFKVSIKGCEARFEMREHFSTAEQAREVVGPFIRQWEFAAALDRDPGGFELVFLKAVVEDRIPSPGVFVVEGGAYMLTGESVSFVVDRGSYPEPPTGVAIDADVEAMALRYSQYREGKETLAAMAFFCLTVLEGATAADKNRRRVIPGKFGIEFAVADTLARLSSVKGGSEARKDEGRSRDFTANERNWIEHATKRMIRRAAEVAHDPAAAASQITMDDLPKLQ
jgi:hypothetical protein